MTSDSTPAPDQAPVTHEPVGESLVLRLSGELDIDAAPGIELAISDAGRFGSSRIVIDLSGLVFADSTVLHLLLSAARRYELRVVGPLRPAVQRLLDVTGTTPLFPVHPDLADALVG